MCALLLVAAAAGQSWVEDGDAPDLLPGQTTIGSGCDQQQSAHCG